MSDILLGVLYLVVILIGVGVSKMFTITKVEKGNLALALVIWPFSLGVIVALGVFILPLILVITVGEKVLGKDNEKE